LEEGCPQQGWMGRASEEGQGQSGAVGSMMMTMTELLTKTFKTKLLWSTASGTERVDFRERRCNEMRPFVSRTTAEHSPIFLQFFLSICLHFRSLYRKVTLLIQTGTQTVVRTSRMAVHRNWSHVQLRTCSVGSRVYCSVSLLHLVCQYFVVAV